MVFGALMVVFGVACVFSVDNWTSYVAFGIWVGVWVSSCMFFAQSFKKKLTAVYIINRELYHIKSGNRTCNNSVKLGFTYFM